MLYVFHGTNRQRLRDEAKKLIDGLLHRKPDAAVVRLSEDNWNEAVFDASIGTQGLFNSASIVYLDGLIGFSGSKQRVAEQIEGMADSANVFVVIEARIDKATLGKIEKVAKKVLCIEKEEKGRDFILAGGRTAPKDFNVFALADAFASRDRARLFALFHDALRREIPEEEIAGTLFWQVKALISASHAKTAGEADLKPYAYTKAKASARNFTREELSRFSRDIVLMYHDAHAGRADLAVSLERLILSV
jgi:DNA polymerase III delta subunit